VMKAFGILGSRRLGWVLALCLTGIYLWLSFNGEDPMGRWLHVVYHEPLGMALWLGLAVNLVMRAVWMMIDRLRPVPPVMEAMDHVVDVSTGEGFDGWLNKHFGVEGAKGTVMARRGRLSVLPGVLLRVGVAVAMAALLASAHVRSEENASFMAHQDRSLLGQRVTLTDLESGLPKDYLSSGDNEGFHLKHPSATLELEGQGVSLNETYPAHVGGVYYRMTDIRLYLPITVGGSAVSREVGGHLDLLPPGRTANIFLPDVDATLTLKLSPASTMQKGLITGKVYDLVNPSYEVSIKRGTEDAKTTSLEAGEKAFMSDVLLSLGKTRPSVEIQAVRDPALWWFLLGMWLLMAGLVLTPLRLIWYMKEIRIEFADGRARIGYSEEFFKKWAGVRFETWVQEREEGTQGPR
jgi:hypothetical protein